MKRQRKKYETPFRKFDKKRIEAERELLKKYGLKTKKELWRMEQQLRKYRRFARQLAAKRDKGQEKILVEKLVGMGILKEGGTLDDVLGINLEDFLNRRLQTVLVQRGLANTSKQARQMIVHGNVKIGEREITYPSYFVQKREETDIQVKFSVGKKTETKPVQTVTQ